MNYWPNRQGVIWFAKEVFPTIKDRVPNAVFYVVGKDPTPDVLQLHNGNDIVVTGAVPRTDEYIDKADLCVLPLVSGTGVGGGLKIKLLDWLVVGKTVVTTSATVHNTDLAGVVLTADDPTTFANRCIEVLCQPTRYRHLSSKAIDLVDRFYGTKETATILTTLFHKIIQKKQVAPIVRQDPQDAHSPTQDKS